MRRIHFGETHPPLLPQAAKAGALYFAVVFATGFALGVLRVLWLVPRIGERTAELVEAPLMLLASFLWARWTMRRMSVPPIALRRLATGLVALALLLATELTVVLQLRGLTFADYIAGRDPIAGSVYMLDLLLFALMPLLVARR